MQSGFAVLSARDKRRESRKSSPIEFGVLIRLGAIESRSIQLSTLPFHGSEAVDDWHDLVAECHASDTKAFTYLSAAPEAPG